MLLATVSQLVAAAASTLPAEPMAHLEASAGPAPLGVPVAAAAYVVAAEPTAIVMVAVVPHPAGVR